MLTKTETYLEGRKEHSGGMKTADGGRKNCKKMHKHTNIARTQTRKVSNQTTPAAQKVRQKQTMDEQKRMRIFF